MLNSIAELQNFYETQKPAWEKLRAARQAFDLNRYELVKDDDAAAGLKRIEEILSAEAPYGLIKEADKLIARVGEINNRLVQERRDHAIALIDGAINKVKGELDEVGAAPELRNRCLLHVPALKPASIPRAVSPTFTSSNLRRAMPQTRPSLKSRRLPINRRRFRPAMVAGRRQAGVLDEPQVQKPPTKKRRIVQPMRLAGAAYLETPDDVDAFLDRLRTELEDAIKNNERIEIR